MSIKLILFLWRTQTNIETHLQTHPFKELTVYCKQTSSRWSQLKCLQGPDRWCKQRRSCFKKLKNNKKDMGT